ncbi:hypothetical protein V6615_01270 [Oscillospiraceae bacterium PP1C4]
MGLAIIPIMWILMPGVIAVLAGIPFMLQPGGIVVVTAINKHLFLMSLPADLIRVINETCTGTFHLKE